GKQCAFTASDMCVAGDDSRVGYEKSCSGTIRALEIKNCRFSASDKIFERKFRARNSRWCGASGADFSGKRVRDGIELDIEVAGLEKEVFAVFAAAERDPLHRAFGEGNFFCGIAG